jgi:GDP-4-dehydro-6-deoxy-D-mannose reductase
VAERETRVQVLITGATGFVGRHLTAYLRQAVPDAVLVGTTLTQAADTVGIRYVACDLRDGEAVQRLMEDVKPVLVVHLAGQASIPQSFIDAWGTFETNIHPLLNLLQACVRAHLNPRILVVTSAEIYGRISPEHLPVTEDAPLRPANPYSVSKATQDLLAQQFFYTYHLPVICARPFNHLGAGQTEDFVATAFAMQIARIEAGLQEPVIRVGNLTSSRDFTDVRDIVRAYHLLLERGIPGTAYNIASGRSVSIQHILDTLLSFTTASVEVVVDQERLRPIDVPVVAASCERLRAATGWQPSIPLEQTLRDVLADCRARVAQQNRSSS